MEDPPSHIKHENLVNHLRSNKIITSTEVYQAMKLVDRSDFSGRNPYSDSSQEIGCGVTISAPHMHARCLELLRDHLRPGCRALDVGSGSGYVTTCMAKMVGETGHVLGVDHIEKLVEGSRVNVSKSHRDLLDSGNMELVVGDGREGWAARAPYDAINVGAAADETPDALLSQLAPGGRLVIPVGQPFRAQTLWRYDKPSDGGEVVKTEVRQVEFVPLTAKDQQWPDSDPE